MIKIQHRKHKIKILIKEVKLMFQRLISIVKALEQIQLKTKIHLNNNKNCKTSQFKNNILENKTCQKLKKCLREVIKVEAINNFSSKPKAKNQKKIQQNHNRILKSTLIKIKNLIWMNFYQKIKILLQYKISRMTNLEKRQT